MASPSRSLISAKSFLEFVNQTGSPYHSVAVLQKMLSMAGFKQVREEQAPWKLQKGGKYFLTKQGSTVCAFVIGNKFQHEDGGFVILGGHTDSPCLRLRPHTKVVNDKPHVQVGVCTYGGGLWHTWLDRPLGLAGKVVVKDVLENQKCEERLLRIAEPVMIIPNLAIHLQSADERKAFALNTETNLQPVLCMRVPEDSEKKDADKQSKPSAAENCHHDELLTLIASKLGCEKQQIGDLDLCLFDAEPSQLIGAYEDFVYSGRIDNLSSVWAQFQGLMDFAADTESVAEFADIAMCVAFDHEECGSESSCGADGASLNFWVNQVLREASDGKASVDSAEWLKVLSHSMLFSMDCAHGLHPNYMGKHQSEHRPRLGDGIVIKNNCNQRYSTTPVTAHLMRRIAELSGASIQDIVVRNDSPCGTTIGPLCSSKLGIRSIDIGIPQWAMHSIKETCSTSDLTNMLKFSTGVFKHFRDVDRNLHRL